MAVKHLNLKEPNSQSWNEQFRMQNMTSVPDNFQLDHDSIICNIGQYLSTNQIR